jgi:hypothetical protein
MTASPQTLHRPTPVHDLPGIGRPFQIKARVEECRELASRFNLVAIEALSAEGVLRPEASGRRVRVEGRLVADLVQTCVVSLDPVPAHIDAPFERLYGWDVDDEWQEGLEEIHLDLASELPAERLTSDVLDLGEVVAEQLALELDPYPRKPGALFTGCDSQLGGNDPGTAKPLEGLSRWRGRDREGEQG